MRKGKFSSVLVAVIGAAVVYGLFWFQYKSGNSSYNHYLVVNMIALLWVPMLTILLQGAEPANFGFAGCSSRGVWIWTGALFAGMLLLLLLVAPWDDFQRYYPIFRRWDEFRWLPAFRPVASGASLAANPFIAAPWTMLFAEASYGLYLFCWEFFFRGYLLFGLQRSVGSIAAVILQALAFGLLHFGKPEMIPSFAGGIILGVLALRAKSFFPCFVLHWAVSICLDLLVVAARHA